MQGLIQSHLLKNQVHLDKTKDRGSDDAPAVKFHDLGAFRGHGFPLEFGLPL